MQRPDLIRLIGEHLRASSRFLGAIGVAMTDAAAVIREYYVNNTPLDLSTMHPFINLVSIEEELSVITQAGVYDFTQNRLLIVVKSKDTAILSNITCALIEEINTIRYTAPDGSLYTFGVNDTVSTRREVDNTETPIITQEIIIPFTT